MSVASNDIPDGFRGAGTHFGVTWLGKTEAGALAGAPTRMFTRLCVPKTPSAHRKRSRGPSIPMMKSTSHSLRNHLTFPNLRIPPIQRVPSQPLMRTIPAVVDKALLNYPIQVCLVQNDDMIKTLPS